MVHNTDAALAKACAATGAEVLNYTAAPVYAGDRTRGRHQWLVEFAVEPQSLPEFARELDTALQRENSDYQAKRSGGFFWTRCRSMWPRRGCLTGGLPLRASSVGSARCRA